MSSKKLLISACLVGRRVRYDGKQLTVTDLKLQHWINKGWVVSVCPEVDAGMSIPRVPAEIINGQGEQVLLGAARVKTQAGVDVTKTFINGAHIALNLCVTYGVKVAVLAESSPSCGSSMIYDGSFTAHKTNGHGVTAALLKQHGIKVFNYSDLNKAFDKIEKALN